MTDPQRDSSWPSFFATAQGRIVTALGIIALVLGIVAEGISIYRGYYEAISARAKAQLDTVRAAAKTGEITFDRAQVPSPPEEATDSKSRGSHCYETMKAGLIEYDHVPADEASARASKACHFTPTDK
jgi:hypothetical protein